MASKYVVINKDLKFLSGPGRWAVEYPEAHKFGTFDLADEEAHKRGGAVVENYGLDSQKVVASYTGSF